MPVQPAARGGNPFDTEGVERDADGVARYANRPDSLVHMLRASVERDRAATAFVDARVRAGCAAAYHALIRNPPSSVITSSWLLPGGTVSASRV
jgi:hypothetical protein